jgi:hypothetical protein
MPNVLIRDVPADDLDQLRSAAAARDTSLQNYLRDAVHAQAVYLRRRAALTRAAERLRDRTRCRPASGERCSTPSRTHTPSVPIS